MALAQALAAHGGLLGALEHVSKIKSSSFAFVEFEDNTGLLQWDQDADVVPMCEDAPDGSLQEGKESLFPIIEI